MTFWAAILAHPVVAAVWALLILAAGIEVGIVLEMRWQETMRRVDASLSLTAPARGRVVADDEALPAWRNADETRAVRERVQAWMRGEHPPECGCTACLDRAQAEALLASCGMVRELKEAA